MVFQSTANCPNLVRYGRGKIHLSAEGLPPAPSLFLGFVTSLQLQVQHEPQNFCLLCGICCSSSSWTRERIVTENYYDYLLGMVSYSPVISFPVTAVICLNIIGHDA